MIPPTTTGMSPPPASRSAVDHVRDQLAVRAREDREPDHVHALVDRASARSAPASGGCPRRRRPCRRRARARRSARRRWSARRGPACRRGSSACARAPRRRARPRRAARRSPRPAPARPPRRRRSARGRSRTTSRSALRPLAGRRARAGGGDRRRHDVLVGAPRRARSSSSAAAHGRLVARARHALERVARLRPRRAGSTTRIPPSASAVSGDGSVSVKRLTPTSTCSPDSIRAIRSRWDSTSAAFMYGTASTAPPLLLDARHLLARALEQLGDEPVHHLRALEDVGVLEQVGLVGEHLLDPQRPLLVPRARQAERLVPGRQLDRPRARVAARASRRAPRARSAGRCSPAGTRSARAS